MGSFFVETVVIFLSIIAGILTFFIGPTKDSPWPGIIVLTILVISIIVLRHPFFIVRDFLRLPDDSFNKDKVFPVKIKDQLLDKVARLITKDGVVDEIEKKFLDKLSKLYQPLFQPIFVTASFKNYCETCEQMVLNSGGTILTMQTPHDVAASESPFKEYLKTTVKRLLEKSNRTNVVEAYHRLIIVDNRSMQKEIEKVELFLDELFTQGNQHDPKPTYDNILICVINKSLVGKLFYSNLDIHITSNHQFALAFQEPKGNGDCLWSSSLHVKALQDHNITTLKKAFEFLWQTGKSYNGEMLFKNSAVYNADNLDYVSEQRMLKSKITDIIRKVAQVID